MTEVFGYLILSVISLAFILSGKVREVKDVLSNVQCPHCKNDDSKMITISSRKDKPFHCEVCSKDF